MKKVLLGLAAPLVVVAGLQAVCSFEDVEAGQNCPANRENVSYLIKNAKTLREANIALGMVNSFIAPYGSLQNAIDRGGAKNKFLLKVPALRALASQKNGSLARNIPLVSAEELARLRDRVAACANFESEIRRLRSRVADCANFESEIARQSRLIRDLHQRIRDLETELNLLRQKAAQGQPLGENCDALRAEVADLKSRLSVAQTAQHSAETRANQAEARAQKAEKDLKNASTDDANKLRTKVTDLEKQLNDCKTELQDLKNQFSSFVIEAGSHVNVAVIDAFSDTTHRQIIQAIEKLKQDLQDKETELNTLKAENAQLNKENAGLKAQGAGETEEERKTKQAIQNFNDFGELANKAQNMGWSRLPAKTNQDMKLVQVSAFINKLIMLVFEQNLQVPAQSFGLIDLYLRESIKKTTPLTWETKLETLIKNKIFDANDRVNLIKQLDSFYKTFTK